MKRTTKTMMIAVCVVPLACGFILGNCNGLTAKDFVQVSQPGFDPVDFDEDRNHYPWSMAHFVPDGEESGHVYVGTGNNITQLIGANRALQEGTTTEYDSSLTRPPEIRRYRPDMGLKTWEKVFDYRDHESEGEYETVGFRQMLPYRAESDGVNYLYAGTFSVHPSLWRSPTGESGSWEKVWVGDPPGGSLRAMAVHDGLLYFALTEELMLDPLPVATVWATDGEDFWQVVNNGFGNPNNTGVAALASYNGWLYVGLANYVEGYEIWKLEGPGAEGETPVRVVSGGGSNPRNEIAGTMCVFQNRLYVGSLMFFGINRRTGNILKTCEMIRIDADDQWETVVGQGSVNGYRAGFNRFMNVYLWSMAVCDDWLYAGTWDMSYAADAALRDLPSTLDFLLGGFDGAKSGGDPGLKRDPTLIDRAFHAGADLYKSPDGLRWFKVFDDGLGNPECFGIRTMEAVDDTLYIGLSNPVDGLEVWRGRVDTE